LKHRYVRFENLNWRADLEGLAASSMNDSHIQCKPVIITKEVVDPRKWLSAVYSLIPPRMRGRRPIQ